MAIGGLNKIIHDRFEVAVSIVLYRLDDVLDKSETKVRFDFSALFGEFESLTIKSHSFRNGVLFFERPGLKVLQIPLLIIKV